MVGEQGFSYSEVGLDTVVRRLRDGARRLDEACRAPIDAPDAGASSAVVGEAIAALLKSAFAAEQLLDNNANLVHAANGGYGPTENDNAGRIWREYERDSAADTDALDDHNYPLN
ncbi:MAG: hypothetical protein ACRDQ5_03980 [Sciscionella sp.]